MYNEVIDQNIQALISSAVTKADKRASPASVEMISFYITVGLIGKDEQLAAYCSFMEKIKDDSVQDQVLQINQNHFTPPMLEDLYHTKIMVGTYD